MTRMQSVDQSAGRGKRAREDHPLAADELLHTPVTARRGGKDTAAPPPSGARPSRRKAVKRVVEQPPAADSERAAVATDERQQMIAESAYYRAERRGFRPGNELIDWLEAEQEIDAMLNEPNEGAEPPLV